MKITLIVGAVVAAICIGIGVYFLTIGEMTTFAVMLFAAILCFWPSVKKYCAIRMEEKEKESKNPHNSENGDKKE